MKTRAEYNEMVKGPGKFESEPAWAPYFWELACEGEGETVYSKDGEEVIYDWFRINSDDAEIFPEIEKYIGKVIHIREDSQGFVYSKIFE